MRLAFVQWIREERKFESLDELRLAIADDCAKAKALFARLSI
jgi:FAD synthase